MPGKCVLVLIVVVSLACGRGSGDDGGQVLSRSKRQRELRSILYEREILGIPQIRGKRVSCTFCDRWSETSMQKE